MFSVPAVAIIGEKLNPLLSSPHTSFYHSTAATAQLASRVLLLQHLLFHQVMLYTPCQIVPLHQGWDFPPFQPCTKLQQLCSLPGQASLPALGNPCFAMPMLAAASALFMPRPPHSQTPTHHHCPACTCGPNSGPAGDGLGSQPTVC